MLEPLSVSSMLKLSLRLLSSALVVAGAVALAHVATPSVGASLPTYADAFSGNLVVVAAIAPSAPRPEVAPRALVSPGRVTPPVTARLELSPRLAEADDGYFPSDRRPEDPWDVPSWFRGSTDITSIEGMNQKGPQKGPKVLSRSAFVYDIDAGAVLYEKNADDRRPVASITKLVSSLALVSANPDLERSFCIGAEQYPTRSGAPSRLSTGDCVTGWDVLGAALVSSDNRGAYAMAAAAGMGVDTFIARMNDVSADLSMDHSTWADPSGLEDENLSTARDITRAAVAVASHPLLSNVASAPFWDLHRENKEVPRRLFSTDRLAGREDLHVLAAKTGYTDTARYCFATVIETSWGQRLAITLLGGDGKLTRWADIGRILSWAEGQQRNGDALVDAG